MYRTWLFFILLFGLYSEGVISQVASEPSVSITPSVSNPFNTTPSTSNTPTTTYSFFTTTPSTSDPPTIASPTSSFITTATTFTTTSPTPDPPTTTSPTSSFIITATTFTTTSPTPHLPTTTSPTSDPPTTTSPTFSFFPTAITFTTTSTTPDLRTTTSPTSSFFTTATTFTTASPTSDPPTTTSPTFSFFPTAITFTTTSTTPDLRTTTSPTSSFITTATTFTTTSPTSDPPTSTSPDSNSDTSTSQLTSSTPTTTILDVFTGSSSTTYLPNVDSGTDRLVITWTPALGNVDYYQVFLGNVYQRVKSPTATFSALPPGTEYNATVQAVSGNLTRTIATMTVATHPTPPGNIHQTIGADTVTLVWDSPANMSNVKKSFNITVTRNDPYRSGSSIYKSETTNITVSGLTPGNYTFNIVTVGALNYTSTPKTVSIQLPNSPSPTDNHVGVIVGAVVGSVGGVIVICLLGFLIWKIVRKRKLSLDNRPSKSHIAKAEQFEEIFKMKERDPQVLSAEFSALQCIGALQSRSISTHPKNATKNHPEAVFPYDHSLVKLSKDGNSSNGYINASYIPGQKFRKEFIAAQSPLQETVNDFWQMVWEQRVATIIMFSSGEEDAPASSEVYWPSTESRLFGNVLVTYVEEKPSVGWTCREFALTHVKKKGSFQVKQFQYTSWPVDTDLCEQELLINFVTHVVQHREQHPSKYPTLVHCRTGGSRCGIFIALSRIATQLEMDNTVDVYNTVNDLFLCRPSMIQTKDEYLFLHRCTLDIIRARDRRNSDPGYTDPDGHSINSDDPEYQTVINCYTSTANDYENIDHSTIDI